MNVDDLLAPVSEESPAGEDLSYDSERQVIEQAFEVPADDPDQPDWRETVRLVRDQLGRSKDAWLGVYLARAGARQGQLETVDQGLSVLAGLFEQYWDSVHPTLDELGFQGRKAPCESLTRIPEFIGPLRRTALVSHPRLGVYTGEDLERFAAEGENAENYGMFRAAVADMDVEDIRKSIDHLDSIRDAVRRVDAVLVANAGDETGTNFATTYETIEGIRRSLAPYAGVESEEGDASAPAESAGNGGGDAGPRLSGAVRSRDDVIRAIDAIADYYRQAEPTSPVPSLLQRARAWVHMDFMQVIDDLLPDSTPEAKRVLWTRADRDAEAADQGSY